MLDPSDPDGIAFVADERLEECATAKGVTEGVRDEAGYKGGMRGGM